MVAVESLTRANKASVARAQDFDADRLLLGTPGGVVDLRTDTLRPARREDLLTPATAVDHIVPRAQGGTDDQGNLAAICDPCHRDKAAAEAARAQGRKPRRRVEFDAQGRVIW